MRPLPNVSQKAKSPKAKIQETNSNRFTMRSILTYCSPSKKDEKGKASSGGVKGFVAGGTSDGHHETVITAKSLNSQSSGKWPHLSRRPKITGTLTTETAETPAMEINVRASVLVVSEMRETTVEEIDEQTGTESGESVKPVKHS